MKHIHRLTVRYSSDYQRKQWERHIMHLFDSLKEGLGGEHKGNTVNITHLQDMQ